MTIKLPVAADTHGNGSGHRRRVGHNNCIA